MATPELEQEIQEFLTALLRLRTVKKVDKFTDDVELYSDCGLYGFDLEDLAVALHEKFGTDFTGLDVSTHGPAEGANMEWMFVLLGRPRKWASITVGDMRTAVVAGSWRARAPRNVK